MIDTTLTRANTVPTLLLFKISLYCPQGPALFNLSCLSKVVMITGHAALTPVYPSDCHPLRAGQKKADRPLRCSNAELENLLDGEEFHSHSLHLFVKARSLAKNINLKTLA